MPVKNLFNVNNKPVIVMMNTELIIITHGTIGQSLLDATTLILGTLPLPVTNISIDTTSNLYEITEQLQQLINIKKNPILILTDVVGATPYNLIKKLHFDHELQILSGVNLPMLLKIMNYAKLPLPELIEKALLGGKTGIIQT